MTASTIDKKYSKFEIYLQPLETKMKNSLNEQKCIACEGEVQALNAEQIKNLLPQLAHEWQVDKANKILYRDFHFKNYYQTMAFVNALAWIAHQQGHHPDLSVHYNKCVVQWNTHAIDGLSINDFICAAKTDQLLQN